MGDRSREVAAARGVYIEFHHETRPNNRKEGQMFMDITDFRDLGKIRVQSTEKVSFSEELIF